MLKRYSRFALVLLLCVIICGGIAKAQDKAVYPIEAYFSPNGHVADRIIKAIDISAFSIDLAIFDLTSLDIKSALERAKNRGVKIRIAADSRQAKGANSVVQSLIDEGFDIRIRHGNGRGIMHNKFCIFDKKLMVTGSYNWTYNAEHNNYENAMFIADPEAIKKYQQYFNNIWGI